MQTMLPRLAAAAGGGHSTPLTGLMRGPNAVEAPLCSQIVLKHITSMLPLIKLAQPAQDAAGALPACPLLSHRASMCTTRPSAACMHPCQALPPHHPKMLRVLAIQRSGAAAQAQSNAQTAHAPMPKRCRRTTERCTFSSLRVFSRLSLRSDARSARARRARLSFCATPATACRARDELGEAGPGETKGLHCSVAPPCRSASHPTQSFAFLVYLFGW